MPMISWIGWLKYGVRSNQVLQWWRLYRDGTLNATTERVLKLLPGRDAGKEGLAQPRPTEEA
jgi:hypothetical protein